MGGRLAERRSGDDLGLACRSSLKPAVLVSQHVVHCEVVLPGTCPAIWPGAPVLCPGQRLPQVSRAGLWCSAAHTYTWEPSHFPICMFIIIFFLPRYVFNGKRFLTVTNFLAFFFHFVLTRKYPQLPAGTGRVAARLAFLPARSPSGVTPCTGRWGLSSESCS